MSNSFSKCKNREGNITAYSTDFTLVSATCLLGLTGANGYRSDKAVIQVQAAARWLSELLKQTTGKQFHVKPVIVFPGWFIETKPEAKNAEIWVLNPKSLPTYIANNRESISPEDVALVAHSLSMYIRNLPSK